MSKCLDPFRFLLISLAVWMNQQGPISTRPNKPRSRDRMARRSYAPCPRFWRLMCDPWSFRDTRRLVNPEVSDGDATLGWPWHAADRVFGPYAERRSGGCWKKRNPDRNWLTQAYRKDTLILRALFLRGCTAFPDTQSRLREDSLQTFPGKLRPPAHQLVDRDGDSGAKDVQPVDLRRGPVCWAIVQVNAPSASCGRTRNKVCALMFMCEPYELRGSRTVLREVRGEIPRAYSPRRDVSDGIRGIGRRWLVNFLATESSSFLSFRGLIAILCVAGSFSKPRRVEERGMQCNGIVADRFWRVVYASA